MFSSIVHISPTTSLVVGTNPPAHPQWHDAVLDLHAHEYTAVHTRGQHPFSPFHISLLCIFMCIVGTWNMLLFPFLCIVIQTRSSAGRIVLRIRG